MFQKHKVHVLFETVGLPEQFDTSFLKNSPKNETVQAKKLFLGRELEGGLKKNGFTQILFISKTFKINFMSWDTDLGSMSPFPLV